MLIQVNVLLSLVVLSLLTVEFPRPNLEHPDVAEDRQYAMTAMVMAVLSSIIVFMFFQKYIVKGVVAGAVKG